MKPDEVITRDEESIEISSEEEIRAKYNIPDDARIKEISENGRPSISFISTLNKQQMFWVNQIREYKLAEGREQSSEELTSEELTSEELELLNRLEENYNNGTSSTTNR